MNKLETLMQRKENCQRELERIRADRHYNEGAKARRIAPIYRDFKTEERWILDEIKAETAERAARKGRKALEPSAIFGADKALVQMNYRAALDSVEGLTDPKDLDARLERAIVTGDTTLATAVAYRANETGNAGVVNKYLDTDKDTRQAWEEWGNSYEDLERLRSYGVQLAFGYSEVEGPREMRLGNLEPQMEARMETVRGRGDAA